MIVNKAFTNTNPQVYSPVHAGNLVDSPCNRLTGEIATDLLYSHANAAAIRRKVGPMTTFSSVRDVSSAVTPPRVENEAMDDQ